MALVTCACAFRLCRLAQNGCRGSRVRHFPCKFPHKVARVKFPCAFRLRRLAQNETSHTEILPRDLLSKACCCTEIETSYEDLVQRSCQETSYRDLSSSSFRDLVQTSCQETSYKILYRDMVKRAAIFFRYLFIRA